MTRCTLMLTAFTFAAGARFAHAQEEAGEASAQFSVEEPAKIVIIGMSQCCSAEAWPEAESKSRDEFKALELAVEIKMVDGEATSEGDQRAELELVAAREDALCAVRIKKGPIGSGNAELWVADRLTQKTLMRSISVEGKSDVEGAAIAALGLVELFQAAMIEMNLPGAPKGEAAPPQIKRMAADMVTVEKVVEVVKEIPVAPPGPEPVREPGPFGLRLGCAASGSPAGAGALGSVFLALKWNIIPLLALEIDGAVSFAGKDVTLGDLRASLDVAHVRAWFLIEFIRHRVIRAALGAGTGLLVLWSTGTPAEGFVNERVVRLSGYLGAGAQLGIVLTRHLLIRFGFTTGFAVPRVAVYLGENKAASFGMPYLEGTVGLEVNFP